MNPVQMINVPQQFLPIAKSVPVARNGVAAAGPARHTTHATGTAVVVDGPVIVTTLVLNPN